jgi:uncharacterized membrane protein (UPF0127 family)
MHRVTAHELRGMWATAKGLIGTDTVTPVYFRTRWGIHTFGVRFPIDIVILDATSHIAAIRPSLPPNRCYLWNPLHDTVLELPVGSIGRFSLHIGDPVVILPDGKK